MSDPDLVDDPPRYSRPPEGGWEAVGDAVLQIYAKLQESIVDPLKPDVVLDHGHDDHLSSEQEWIIGTWFTSEAPTLWVGDESWINGRHRSWGLKTAGFHFVPAILIPPCDAISGWRSELNNGWPFDQDSLRSQQRELARWRTDNAVQSWRAANPAVEIRWSTIIDRWAERLTDSREQLPAR